MDGIAQKTEMEHRDTIRNGWRGSAGRARGRVVGEHGTCLKVYAGSGGGRAESD